MNCKHTKELLPLYAGHDLNEKRARLVSAHLQSCRACARLADEYLESIQLTQQFAPPTFNEDVYARLRQRVLRELEPQRIAPPWWQMTGSLFQLRLRSVLATMLLIALSLFAVYFITNRGNDLKESANQRAGTVPATNQRLDSEREANKRDLSSSVNKDAEKPQLAEVRPQRKKSRYAIANSINDVARNLKDALSKPNQASPQTSELPASTFFPPREAAASGKTLRMEIQTKDPNIRIIWFTQRSTKPALPNSKGI